MPGRARHYGKSKASCSLKNPPRLREGSVAWRWQGEGNISLGALFRLLVDQHGLLPLARRLVRAMNTPCPAARPLLPLQHFLTSARDAARTRRGLFRVFDPADKFITA